MAKTKPAPGVGDGAGSPEAAPSVPRRGGPRPGAGRPRAGGSHTVSLTVNDAQLAALERAARARGTSRSALLREALEAWLEQQG